MLNLCSRNVQVFYENLLLYTTTYEMRYRQNRMIMRFSEQGQTMQRVIFNTHNPKVAGSNPAPAIYHVYAPCDIDTIALGVYFCYIGFDKALDAIVIEVFSVFL